MAERTIVLIGDPILRKVCTPVPAVRSHEIKLLDDLIDTLYAVPGRAGLAAPQIGIAKRIAVLDCGDGLIELINPELIDSVGEQVSEEACLSIPGIFGKVKRAKTVTVKTLTRSGEEIILKKQGTTAICIQHEMDHLDGKLFIDHVQPDQLFHEMTGEKMNPLEWILLSRKTKR